MQPADEISPEVMLAEDIAGFTHDPLGYALYSFPWGEASLADVQGPREWQTDVLRAIGLHLQNPETRHEPLRIGIASGHGIGKSALISMIVDWATDTCENTRVVLTANTEAQLRTKTWPEVIKWRLMSITAGWWKATKTGLFSLFQGHAESWRCDAVTWSEQNTEAFAGLHNKGSRIVVIFDEASKIADKVWEVTEGALTDEGTEIIWIAFGNPTRNTGRFRECFGRYRHLWKTRQIDSRTVEGTNKKFLQEMVDTYGEDSDIVKVRVRGMFPSASSMQFIGSDLVEAAMKRQPVVLINDPLIYGVDCARFGDDESVLAKRQGRDARSRPWKKWRGVDTMTLAGDIALEAQQEHPDAIMVDVGAMGAGVVDRLRQLLPGTLIVEVNFGGKGRDTTWAAGVTIRTANKRAEIWSSMRAWLEHGAIPEDDELKDDLTNPEYTFDQDQKIVLEKKDHMKARGLPSPDRGDALACTFAQPVAPRVPKSRDPASYIPAPASGAHYDRYAELGD